MRLPSLRCLLQQRTHICRSTRERSVTVFGDKTFVYRPRVDSRVCPGYNVVYEAYILVHYPPWRQDLWLHRVLVYDTLWIYSGLAMNIHESELKRWANRYAASLSTTCWVHQDCFVTGLHLGVFLFHWRFHLILISLSFVLSSFMPILILCDLLAFINK